MMEEQEGTEKKHWTPSEVIRRLGKEINNEDSVYYWCYKVSLCLRCGHRRLILAQNDIPVFSPALTDGSLGDMLYFHSYKNPGFIIDIVGDIRRLNDISIHAKKAGMIVLGGGVCKHQIANAMLFVSQGQSLVKFGHSFFAILSETAPTMQSISTRGKNSTDLILALVPMRRCRGERFVQEQSRQRCVKIRNLQHNQNPNRCYL